MGPREIAEIMLWGFRIQAFYRTLAGPYLLRYLPMTKQGASDIVFYLYVNWRSVLIYIYIYIQSKFFVCSILRCYWLIHNHIDSLRWRIQNGHDKLSQCVSENRLRYFFLIYSTTASINMVRSWHVCKLYISKYSARCVLLLLWSLLSSLFWLLYHHNSRYLYHYCYHYHCYDYPFHFKLYNIIIILIIISMLLLSFCVIRIKIFSDEILCLHTNKTGYYKTEVQWNICTPFRCVLFCGGCFIRGPFNSHRLT